MNLTTTFRMSDVCWRNTGCPRPAPPRGHARGLGRGPLGSALARSIPLPAPLEPALRELLRHLPRTAPALARNPRRPAECLLASAALTVAPEAVTKTFLTSGTTGVTRGAHHFVDTRIYEQAVQSGWMRLALSQPEFPLIADALDAPQSSLSHMMFALGVRAGSSFIAADGRLQTERADRGLEQERIVANAPLILPGTALAFLNFFEQLGDRRLALPDGQRRAGDGRLQRQRAGDRQAGSFTRCRGEFLGTAPRSGNQRIRK